MSIGSTLKNVLGFVAGILIPGASKTAVDSIHAVQQELANLYGVAATKLANDLKTDTSLSGAQKVLRIGQSIVATAKSQGWKGVESVLFDAALDVGQTAYRNSLPTIEDDAKALLVSLHLAPALETVAELVLPAVEKAAEDAVAGVLHLGGGAAAAPAA